MQYLTMETKTIFLSQTVNMFISASKLDIGTWGSMEIDLLLESAPSPAAMFVTSALNATLKTLVETIPQRYSERHGWGD